MNGIIVAGGSYQTHHCQSSVKKIVGSASVCNTTYVRVNVTILSLFVPIIIICKKRRKIGDMIEALLIG